MGDISREGLSGAVYEALIRLAAEEGPDLLWATDSAHHLIWLGGAGLEAVSPDIAGQTENIRDVSLETLFGLDDPRSSLLTAHHEALQGRASVFDFQTHGNHFRGKTLPFFTRSGKVTGCLGCAREVHREAEAAVELDHVHPEDLFEGLLEAAPDSLIITNEKGEIVLVYAMTETLFGFSREELCGQMVEKVIPPRLAEIHRQHRQRFTASPKVRRMGSGIAFPAFRKDGSEFPAEISLSPLQTDRGLLVFCAVRDISERLNTETALARSREGFELAVRGTDLGTWDWNIAEDQVYLSPRWKAMLGFADQEIEDDRRGWENLIHPEDREGYRESLTSYLQGTAKEFETEFRLRHKDGSFRWVVSRGVARWGEDGKPYRMVGSTIDVTHKKELERSLRRQEAELLAARGIQKQLLPTEVPRLPGYEVAAINIPAEFTAGDHYDFIPLNDGSIGFAISDVTGHGFSSALLAGTTHAYLHAFLDLDLEVEDLMTRLSATLFRETEVNRFVTLLFAKLDPATRWLHFANAGHPCGLVLDREGNLTARLSSTGLPLGTIADAEYSAGEPVQLEDGNLVVLVTDGVLEAESAAGEEFGEERLRQVLRENRARPAQEILDRLYGTMQEFSGSDRIEDDVTAILIKVLP